MRVRCADVTDALAIAVVHVISSRAAYQGLLPQRHPDSQDIDQRREVWERILAEADRPRSTTLVADNGDGLVGFADLCPTRDQDADPLTVGEITAIYLLPAVWGTGVGTLLLTESVNTLGEAGYRQATLWVLETNHRARRFYEANGWQADKAVKQDKTRGVLRTIVRYRRSVD
ncbi:N-acetyltransferase family protein [Dactylosporangium sp. CA-139066]|uniref:GNAT family N-acetyltransferase n=1 Tax=Dactylosporangium sp. CA-139066 TaxID=3239930 RepID=UPI003D8F655B